MVQYELMIEVVAHVATANQLPNHEANDVTCVGTEAHL